VIFDDFKIAGQYGSGGGGWQRFADNMARVLPDIRFFRSGSVRSGLPQLLRNQSLDNFPQAYNTGRPVFRGAYEDNDRRKRLLYGGELQYGVSPILGMVGSRVQARSTRQQAYKLGVQ